jgi:hypothetical protein
LVIRPCRIFKSVSAVLVCLDSEPPKTKSPAVKKISVDSVTVAYCESGSGSDCRSIDLLGTCSHFYRQFEVIADGNHRTDSERYFRSARAGSK